MNTTQAIELARSLMDKNGLDEWNIKITDDKTRLGYCDYMRKTLAFSKFFFTRPDADATFLNTVRHEMAHAIVGPSVKAHGAEWKAACRRLGGVARSGTSVKMDDSEFAWVGKCPCGRGVKRNHRKPQSFSYTCNTCRKPLAWTHKGKPVKVDTSREIFVSASVTPVERGSVPRKPRTRAVKTGRGAAPFDRGFTDIEALWAD